MGQVSIDLGKAYAWRENGDLIAVFTWVNDERALVLIPAIRKNCGWYIVAESAAWKYDNPDYLAIQCRKACEVLGMEPSLMNWFRVANLIHDYLPDLIEMPSSPDPVLTSGTFGEMTLREAGKILHGEEIRFEREAGAVYGS